MACKLSTSSVAPFSLHPRWTIPTVLGAPLVAGCVADDSRKMISFNIHANPGREVCFSSAYSQLRKLRCSWRPFPKVTHLVAPGNTALKPSKLRLWWSQGEHKGSYQGPLRTLSRGRVSVLPSLPHGSSLSEARTDLNHVCIPLLPKVFHRARVPTFKKALKWTRVKILLVRRSGHHSRPPQVSHVLAWAALAEGWPHAAGISPRVVQSISSCFWVTVHGSGLEEGSPQALLGSRGQLLPCGSKQRVRDVVTPRSRGSTALATLWSGSIGLLEMSQLWLCSVPLGNGCLKALPGWETWQFSG